MYKNIMYKNYLDVLPLEILEYVYYLVHKSRYNEVMESLVSTQFYIFETKMAATAIVEQVLSNLEDN